MVTRRHPSDIAFTPVVKAVQTAKGARAGPARAEPDARDHTHRLTAARTALLERVMPTWRAAPRRAHGPLGDGGVEALRGFAGETDLGG